MAASQELNFAIRAVNEAGRQMKDLQGQLKDAGDAGEKASKGLDKFNESGDKGFSVAGKLGSALGDVAKIAGGFVIGQGLMKLPGFLKDAAQGAADDLQATQRLEQSIRNLGGSFDDTLAKVNDAIDAGAKLAFADDDVRDSFQSLAAATGDADEALKRQRAAMDLARGANIPLATATKMLGKLNEENVEVFKKMGITLGENATETDALAAVQEKFGGQAETFAKGPAGQFEQLKIRIGEAKEALGTALLPVMVKVGDIMAKYVVPAIEALIERFGPMLERGVGAAIRMLGSIASAVLGPMKKFVEGLTYAWEDWEDAANGSVMFQIGATIRNVIIPAIKDFIDKLVEVGQAIGPKLAEGAEKVMGVLQAIGKWFAEDSERLKAAAVGVGSVLAAAFAMWAVSAGAAAVATIAATLPVIAIAAAIAALGAGIYLLITHWDDITAKFPILGTVADAVKTALIGFTDWVTGTFVPAVQTVFTAVVTAATGVVNWFRDNWNGIKEIIGPVFEAVRVIVETQFGLIKIYIETALGVIRGLFDVFAGLFTGDWGRMKDGILKIVDSLKEGAIEAVKLLIKGIQELGGMAWEALKHIGDEMLDGIKSGLSALPGAMEGVGKAAVEGIWKGIQSLSGWLRDQIVGWAKDAIPGWARKALGIESPSKVFADQVGRPIVQGIAAGIQAEWPALRAMMLGLTNSLVASTAAVAGTSSPDTGWGSGGGLVPSTSMPATLGGSEPGFYDSFGNFIPSAGGAGPDGFAPPNGGAIVVVPLAGGGYTTFVPGVTGGAGDVGTAVPYPGVGTAVAYPGPGSLGGLLPFLANDPTVGTAVPYPGVGTAVPYTGGGGAVIPMLAGGGITRRPTLAYIGEREDEIVAPLSQLGSLMQQAGGPKWGRGASVVNHFHGFVGNVRELNRQQERAYRRTFRSTGY